MASYEVSGELEDVMYFHSADGTASVHKKSMLTGIMHKTILPIIPDQIMAWKQQGRLIQDVFPDLPKEDREFLITGCTPEEWAEIFSKGE
jgi:hypothetical protein